MYKSLLRLAKRHWPVSTLIIAGLLAGGLQLLHLVLLAHIVLALSTAGLAVLPLLDTYTSFQTGQLRLNVLLPIVVVAALLQRQYWIALVAGIVYYVGTLIASAAEQRTQRSQLLSLKSLPTVIAVARGRKTIDTAVSELHVGDKIIWASGSLVPVDGVILEGTTNCDEGDLGGKAVPVSKTAGDQILSGSRNQGEPVLLKVQQVADDSYLQTTARLLSKSVGNHTKFVQTSDHYAIYVTLSALIIGAAAWWLGHDAQRFLAVMVAATVVPLLVPSRLALRLAVHKAASKGINFRSGIALQTVAEAKTMVFGFGGVITSGQLIVNKITALKPYTQNEVLGLAASLEQASEHPLAKAVVAAAAEQGFNFISAKHVQTIAGQGLRANLQGQEIVVGSAKLLIEQGITVSIKVPAQDLVVYVAQGGQLAGAISFQASLHSSVAPTFTTLRHQGVRWLKILSNSPQAAVAAITARLGQVDIHAEVPVADKLAILATAEHRPTAYIGSAATDSTLLTAADVGIALGGDITLAAPSAAVSILHADIAYVAVARRYAQRAFTIARQSIVLGTVLSLSLMLVAMSGHLPLLLGLSLQLVINTLVIIYPLLASQKS